MELKEKLVMECFAHDFFPEVPGRRHSIFLEGKQYEVWVEERDSDDLHFKEITSTREEKHE